MKFLIFNLTVAAALVYLLTTDRTEIQNTAGRIHDTATQMKIAAGRAVDRGRRLITRSAPETARGAPIPTPPPAIGATLRATTKSAAPLVPDPVKADRAGPREAFFPAQTVTTRPVAMAPAIPALEIAAKKRRAEILKGIDPAALTPGAKPSAETAQPEIAPALSPAERRKQLYALCVGIARNRVMLKN